MTSTVLTSSVLSSSTPRASARRSSGRPSGPGPRRSASVYLRRRLGVIVGAIALAIVGVGMVSVGFADAGSGTMTPVPVGATGVNTVIAQPGDTLWSLAREVQPKGDVRPLVAQLARRNGGSSVQAGDRIVLPSR